MEDALAEVQRLAGLSGERTRNQIVNSLRNTLYSIESQDETLDRIMFLVRHNQNPKHSSSTKSASAKLEDDNLASISIFKSPLSGWAST